MSDPFDIRYVAKLARLDLSENEMTTFQAQLEQVLGYVDKLSAVDVAGVEPTAHANSQVDVYREDLARESMTVDEALSNAPRSTNGVFALPKVVE